MRKMISLLIVILATFYAAGLALAYFGFVSMNLYINLAGIAGGIASVIGLLSLTKASVTKDDIMTLESSSLESLAKTAAQLRELDARRAQAKNEITGLEMQKKEMELLVKKASTSLFLNEQYSRLIDKINTVIHADPVLLESIQNMQSIRAKLIALDEEIKLDPNVDVLREIINQAEVDIDANRIKPSEKDILNDAIVKAFKFVTRHF